MSDDRRRSRRAREAPEVSDLIGAELAIAVGLWFVVALICFFFVSVVAGIIAVLLGVAAGGFVLYAAIKRADISD